MLGELIGENGQQIERQAGRGHVDQVGMRPFGVDDSQGAEPRGGFRLVVEVASQLVDLHAANAPSQSTPVATENETAWANASCLFALEGTIACAATPSEKRS
jgi:hypothetical protein